MTIRGRPRLAVASVLVLIIGLLAWWVLDRLVVPRFGNPYSFAERDRAIGARPATQTHEGPKHSRMVMKPLPLRQAPARPAAELARRPLPALATPFMEVYPELRRLAAEGDARAACRIAFVLDRCAKMESVRGLPSMWLRNEQTQTDPAQRARLRQLRETAERTARDLDAACKGVPAGELPLAWDYGLQAALAGNRMAMWHVSFFPWGLDVRNPENTLEGWAQYRQYLPGIVEAGVQAGDPRFVSIASRMSFKPWFGARILPEDPVRGLALQMSLLRGVAPSYRPQLERDIAYVVRTESLDERQVAQARTLAATFPPLDVPPGGFDWSFGMASAEDGSECERP